VAAFYPLPSCLFYRDCGGFIIVFLPAPPVCSEIKKVVHWMAEILFATEIAFGSLDRCMPEQKLNLLQLATVTVTELRTGPPQVMRCNVLQARSLTTGLDHVPHDILRDSAAPHFSGPGDGSKNPSLHDTGCSGPLI
jgi:hypothetical protein